MRRRAEVFHFETLNGSPKFSFTPNQNIKWNNYLQHIGNLKLQIFTDFNEIILTATKKENTIDSLLLLSLIVSSLTCFKLIRKHSMAR